MAGIHQSTLARRVRVGGRLAYVRPPSVATALAVFDTLHALVSERPGSEAFRGAVDLLDETLAGWLPLRVARVLTATVDVGHMAAAVLQLVDEGTYVTPDPESPAGEPGDKRETAAAASETVATVRERLEQLAGAPWPQAIARYAGTFGVAPGRVLAEPWPLFLSMQREVDRLEALGELQALRVGYATMPRFGPLDDEARRAQQDRLDHLLVRAFGTSDPFVKPGETEAERIQRRADEGLRELEKFQREMRAHFGRKAENGSA